MPDPYWEDAARKARDLRAKGKDVLIPTHFHRCRGCGGEFVGESRQTLCRECEKAEDARFEREIDEGLTGPEVREK